MVVYDPVTVMVVPAESFVFATSLMPVPFPSTYKEHACFVLEFAPAMETKKYPDALMLSV